MIVYNITYKVRWDILEGWLAWQLEEQVPVVLATGLFTGHRLYRLLDQDEEEGPTFVIQYFASSEEQYRRFIIEFAPAIQQSARGKWGDGFIAFHTVMASVD
jgi:Domain of unknown function (DUF4286)